MRRMALATLLALLALPALAADGGAPAANPMSAWKPPKVRNEAAARKEILALMKRFEQAEKAHDLAAATALVDFPVLMVTDDSRGQGMAASWDRETWTRVMRPFYENPHPPSSVKHAPNVFVMTDSLASLDDVATVTTQDGKTMVLRNNTLLLRKDGKWRVKAMTEGGWGDMMRGGPATRERATGEEAPEEGGTSPGGGSGPER